jgi:plastocyanin
MREIHRPETPNPHARQRGSWPVAGVGLGVAASLLLAACGGGGSSSNSSTQTNSTPPPTSAAPASPSTSGSASGSVALMPKGDQLAFNANNETAKAGKVTINFTNDSSLAHNVTLVNSANKILGQTPTFQGGTKNFSATLKAGSYTYYCSVPGHRQAGMQGTLTVK